MGQRRTLPPNIPKRAIRFAQKSSITQVTQASCMGNQQAAPLPPPDCPSCAAQASRAASEAGRAAAVRALEASASNSSGSSGGAAAGVRGDCKASYAEVERCMREQQGQVNLCQDEWEAFRRCHDGAKRKQPPA